MKLSKTVTGTLFTGSASLTLRFLKCTLQSVVVFEVFQLQQVSGPLAPLLHRRREVGCLGGGGGGARRICDTGQVFGSRLVVLAWSAAAAVRLHTETTEEEEADCSQCVINIPFWDYFFKRRAVREKCGERLCLLTQKPAHLELPGIS